MPNATPNLGGLRPPAPIRLYFNGRTAPSAGAGLSLSRPSLTGAALPTAVSDDPVQILRRQLAELGSVARQLNQAGRDSVRAQLLLSRKRAELEDFINRGQRCQDHSIGTTITRITHPG